MLFKKTLFLCITFICFILLSFNSSHASEFHNPVSRWADLQFISTDELKDLYDSGTDFLLINTLSPIEFGEVTIKGSINLPYDDIKSEIARLPENKKIKLVFFCKGPK